MATQPPQVLTGQRWLDQFNRASANLRLKLLHGIAPPTAREAAPSSRNLFAAERNPAVRAALVRVFGRTWNTEFLDELVLTITQLPQTVQRAVFEIVADHAPHLLRSELHRFLMHRDLHLRVIAIRALAAIDPPAAHEHLEHLLRKGPIDKRRQAMADIIHVPWELAQQVILRVIAEDTDTELLTAACLHFRINPDRSAPFRLLDIAMAAPPAKKSLLTETVTAIAEALRDGVLAPSVYAEFAAELAHWEQVRLAQRFVAGLVERLRTADPQTLVDLEPAILKRLADPCAREQTEKALSWPICAAVKKLLHDFLARAAAPATVARPPATPTSSDDRARAILTMDPATFATQASALATHLADKHEAPQVKGAILRKAIKANHRDFMEFAQRWADRAETPALEMAALEYLETFEQTLDRAQLVHLVERIIVSADPIAKKAVSLRLLHKRYPKEALTLALDLLSSDQRPRQETALSCLVFFDFALYRTKLATFLATGPDPTLFDAGLCLFEANPDPENIYILYSLRKRLTGNAVQHVVRVMEGTDTLLRELFSTESALDPAGMKQLEARWQAEHRRSKAPPPDYALARLQPERGRPSAPDLAGVMRGLFAKIGL